MKLARSPKVRPGVKGHVGADGPRRGPQRHVLIVGLIGRRTPLQKRLRPSPIFSLIGGIVIVDLVVVPGDRERMPRMRRLHAPITFVEGVQVPVLLEGHRLRQVEAHLKTQSLS